MPTDEEDKKEEKEEDAAVATCSSARVFVPLCGKTVDMAYLVPFSSEVVGVEGIETALEEFAKEQPDLKIEKQPDDSKDGYMRYSGEKIQLLKGDFFALTPEVTKGNFDAIFDRAAMVAIDPKMRDAYIEVIGKLMAPKGRILLAALDRRSKDEAATKKGPPFSIPEATVRQIFEGLDWVESVSTLEETDQLVEKPEDKERYADLDQLMQVVYLIQAK